MNKSLAGLLCVVLFVAGTLLSSPAPGADDTAAGDRIETFHPPRLISTTNPVYPRGAQASGKEGWVSASYMVDRAGVPYDVTVTSSSGGQVFEKAAITAIAMFRYEPAEIDGTNIAAGAMINITFELEGETGARPRFVSVQKDLLQQIMDGNQAAADVLLLQLHRSDRNLYEEAYLRLTEYNYFLKWGTSQAQYRALSRATYMDRNRKFLPPAMLLQAVQWRLGLELKLQLFARVQISAQYLLREDISAELRERLNRINQQMITLASDERAFLVAGDISDSNRFSHKLLKSTFSLDDVSGEIAEIRLHCDKGDVGFRYQADMTYTIANGLADCTLVLIGDPGTTFNLTES